MNVVPKTPLDAAIELLNIHYLAFNDAKPFADATQHPTPSDTRSWSQILISLLTGVNGVARQKGSDLSDGSDVKAANVWDAIDTPRFNGVIKSGTKSEMSGKIDYLDGLPYLYFVMWDNEPTTKKARCRVWAVRTQYDAVFREICVTWYKKQADGEIKSDNFQLHPPRNLNTDTFRNTCGNLDYPLLLNAEWREENNSYVSVHYDPEILNSGSCTPAEPLIAVKKPRKT